MAKKKKEKPKSKKKEEVKESDFDKLMKKGLEFNPNKKK